MSILLAFWLAAAPSHAERQAPLPKPTAPKGAGSACRGDAASGWVCRIARSAYPREIGVFVPPGYRPSRDPEWILYIHGWLGVCSGHDSALKEFPFGKMFAAAGRDDALLIVPTSSGRNDTHLAYLTDPRRLERFLEGVGELLVTLGLSESAEPSRLVLAGHSGAGSILSKVLSKNPGLPVREVDLLDAVYEGDQVFAEFAKRPDVRLRTGFVPGTDPEIGSCKIWKRLGGERLLSAANDCRQGRDPAFDRFVADLSSPGEGLPRVAFSRCAPPGCRGHCGIVEAMFSKFLRR